MIEYLLEMFVREKEKNQNFNILTTLLKVCGVRVSNQRLCCKHNFLNTHIFFYKTQLANFHFFWLFLFNRCVSFYANLEGLMANNKEIKMLQTKCIFYKFLLFLLHIFAKQGTFTANFWHSNLGEKQFYVRSNYYLLQETLMIAMDIHIFRFTLFSFQLTSKTYTHSYLAVGT